MNKLRKVVTAVVAMSGLGIAASSLAAVSPEEAARLGQDLTPMGAEKAGNAAGTIPAWTGGLTKAPAGWDPSQGYIDPFKDEKPLFTITAKNYEQYKDNLNEGMIAMLKAKPDTFYMPVYKTHRTFANSEEVYKQVRENAVKTTMDGETIVNYSQPGVPFPIPKTGLEVIENHLLRWMGSWDSCGDWLPVQPDGSYYKVGFCTNSIMAHDLDKKKDENDLFYFFGYYDAPATLVGTIYLIHDVIDKSKGLRRAWIYNAGQRRVRRAPDLAYDNIDDGTEGMRITDDWWGFNGSPDRYNWKIIGKREMYIPYNAYKLSDATLKYDDMLDKGHIKSDLMRYELHRVWEIEATLKDGVSHVYPRRKFYIDEDSWMIALADAYDSRGNLWRVYSDPLMQAYDANIMFQRVYFSHDLISGTFIASQLDNERPQPAIKWDQKGRYADFQTSAIRRRGTR